MVTDTKTIEGWSRFVSIFDLIHFMTGLSNIHTSLERQSRYSFAIHFFYFMIAYFYLVFCIVLCACLFFDVFTAASIWQNKDKYVYYVFETALKDAIHHPPFACRYIKRMVTTTEQRSTCPTIGSRSLRWQVESMGKPITVLFRGVTEWCCCAHLCDSFSVNCAFEIYVYYYYYYYLNMPR